MKITIKIGTNSWNCSKKNSGGSYPESLDEEAVIADTLESLENLDIIFDDPVPKIIYKGHKFAFTGECEFGERKECEKAVVELGGVVGKLTGNTNYLIVGNKGSNYWKKGSFGNKIIKAFTLKNKYGKISIIRESDWVKSL